MGIVALMFGAFSANDRSEIEEYYAQLAALGLVGRLEFWTADGAAFAAFYPPCADQSDHDPLFVIAREPSGIYVKWFGAEAVASSRSLGGCLKG